MPDLEAKVKSLRRTQALVSAVLCALLCGAVFFAVVASNSTTALPQVITGKFMGLSIDGGSLAFQPEGKTTGTSYVFSSDTMWISSTGLVHTSGPAACLQAADKGRKITIGVVWTKPQGYAPGTALLDYVKC
jgi:hypothetical protein